VQTVQFSEQFVQLDELAAEYVPGSQPVQLDAFPVE
jgi:hypothetical protein